MSGLNSNKISWYKLVSVIFFVYALRLKKKKNFLD
jgi:hypothetical protein